MPATRRAFLRTVAGTGLAIYGHLRDDWPGRLAAAEEIAGDRPPEALAGDETFWFQIQQAFDIDRSIINLNNGGVCPSPRIVHDAMKRQLDFANHAPSRHLWQVQDPQVELVRDRLARAFGCDAEEMAITRNASESLQIALNGIDLKPGDEFLTTTQDYPRMLNTIRQREQREGVVMRQVKLPVPVRSHDEIVRLFEEAMTPRTKVLLVCHIINITGEILPVARICAAARNRGIITIVDGAHAFAHFVYRYGDFECDLYGVSLHKWLTAPIGTGFLFVRRPLIPRLWALQAPPAEKAEDIRKFEEIGTHPTAPRLAIAEALTFYEGIGPRRKEERLRWLRNRWVEPLARSDRVRVHTNLAPGHSCAIATMQIEGVDSAELCSWLWKRHKIIVTPIRHEDFEGIRITPNVYTTPQEIELFCDAINEVLRNGLTG